MRLFLFLDVFFLRALIMLGEVSAFTICCCAGARGRWSVWFVRTCIADEGRFV